MSTRIAIYPGSFDPITNGHLDIIKRSLGIFDKIIVGIAVNSRKQTMFSRDERLEIIREVFAEEPRVEVDAFEGLTVEYARVRNACAVLRGLRAVADFEYELQMANMNRKLNKDLETVFMMTSEKSFFVSSQNVKEVARFGGDIRELVPPAVAQHLALKLEQQ
ncbi:MAG: pantetheine-phosphate adenylyltransferase [Deltaproteobacteria bacterium]|nr:pantetheine-phosphate adenylyltransferase [Deltaproteobacteria bacterium]MBN2674629.1 pantetheine-phosphate adenylyltransferase [Deltaproteobacteria bacterium]